MRTIIKMLVAGSFTILYLTACTQRNGNRHAVQGMHNPYEYYTEKAARIIPRVWPELDWSPDELPKEEDFRVTDAGYRVPRYIARSRDRQRVWMSIGLEHDVFIIVNRMILEEVKQRRDANETPTLSIPDVLKRAYDYLNLLEQEIPPDHAVEVWFGSDGRVPRDHLWWVLWQPTVDGVYYDDSYGKYERRGWIYLVFHEQLGLYRYDRVNVYPPPRSMEIKLSPAEAADIAAPLAREVLKTPYYRMWRGDAKQIVIPRLSETKLVISEPNWMLNRWRSTYMRGDLGAPKETRLCWRVKFEVDMKRSEIPTHVVEQYVWIFIDAETGKCVGANFD